MSHTFTIHGCTITQEHNADPASDGYASTVTRGEGAAKVTYGPFRVTGQAILTAKALLQGKPVPTFDEPTKTPEPAPAPPASPDAAKTTEPPKE